MAFPRATAGLTACLAIGQIIGWATTFSAAAVLARPIGQELNLSLAVTLGGASAFLVGLALVARTFGPAYKRWGAGPVISAGSVGTAVTLALLALSQGLVTYLAGWALIGAAGAASLATSANTLLTEHAGREARRWIVGVMLVSGMASSLGIPRTAALTDALGWRTTLFVYAGLNLFVCTPLHILAMRLARRPAASPAASEDGFVRRVPRVDVPGLFPSLVIALSLVNAITWGFSVVILEVLRAYGLEPRRAVELATLTGFAQLAARSLDLLLSAKAEATKIAMFAALTFPVGLAALSLWPDAYGAFIFVLVLGFTGGIMTVARATVPLELFDPSAYGVMVSRLALPMNLSLAAAPFIFGLALEHYGPRAVVMLLALGACGVLGGLIRVRRLAYGAGGGL